MEKTTKKLKLKINKGRAGSISSNGPASASTPAGHQQSPSYFNQSAASPDAISPTSYFPASAAMSPSAGPAFGSTPLISSTMPPPAVPATPTDGRPKIKLRLNSISGRSQPSNPVIESTPSRTPLPGRTPLPAKPPPPASPVAPPTTTKAGRTSKPTAKKRSLEGPESDDDEETVVADGPRPAKRQSIVTKGKGKQTVSLNNNSDLSRRKSLTNRIVMKDGLKTATSCRLPGSGFDSEMEDAETGPITEEQIVFRMMEGPECDYVNECLTNKKFPSGDSMTFKLKWLEERRAVVTVDKQLFAAVLVDLPTVTETTKTWDKKLVVKSADVCQMLLAFAKVTREEEAQKVPLPDVLFDGYRWPHGLTPPMHDAVHRRFRKRLHKTDILNKEQEVNRLLAADKAAKSTRFEFLSERRDTIHETPAGEILDGDGDEDAEGEDEEIDLNFEDPGLDLERELEAEMGMDTPDEANATPVGPVEIPAVPTGGAEGQGEEDLFGDGESGEDYDEDDEESDEDLDQAERQKREEARSVREEVREIDKRIKKSEEELSTQGNQLLKKRIIEKIKGAKEDKRLKLASIGEVPSEDEED